MTPVEILIVKAKDGRLRMRFTTKVDGKETQVWSKPGDDQVEELSITLCHGVLDELLCQSDDDSDVSTPGGT